MVPIDMKGDRYLEAGMAEPQCNDSTQLTEKHVCESTRSESPTYAPPVCSRVRRFGLVLALIAVLGFTFDVLSTGYGGLCRHGMYHMPGYTNTSDTLAIFRGSHEELHDEAIEVVNFIGKRQDNESSTNSDGPSVPSDDAATTVPEIATTTTVVTSVGNEVTSEPPPPTTTSESEPAEPTTSTPVVEETTTLTTRVPEETTSSVNPPVPDTSSSDSVPESEPETSTTADPVSTPNPVTSGTSITSEGPPPSTSSSSQTVAETTSTSQYAGDIYHVR
ncbi:hypothetical protein S40285_01675 [Stachybotrys chlorohalonatus IBT 40285]|uniref:Uncharacterized protein n=1 Tax=Stachybotrys chlorohalonatus (strain IBT 40285) TaxID=1283841 RepID=A0A084QE15_STAC4|nr:hypothetical protein S40285_01675 [Stachybotrys chlorohalonata IBT 40285]